MWNKAAILLRLPYHEQLLLIEALSALAMARLKLLFTPFRRIAASLGDVGGESPDSAPPLHDHVAGEVGWAVETMARNLPWESRCLAQALAARQMLHRRGICATIYFGVANNADQAFEAHAWLRCGKRIVTGDAPQAEYRVLTNFAMSLSKANPPQSPFQKGGGFTLLPPSKRGRFYTSSPFKKGEVLSSPLKKGGLGGICRKAGNVTEQGHQL